VCPSALAMRGWLPTDVEEPQPSARNETSAKESAGLEARREAVRLTNWCSAANADHSCGQRAGRVNNPAFGTSNAGLGGHQGIAAGLIHRRESRTLSMACSKSRMRRRRSLGE
jgi:hypothetical protein